MKIKLLGTSAGGGFPQWNCGCANCRGIRAGTRRAKPRTQLQVAITADERHWFLLNASPDLRTQIESTPELHPRDRRHSPIAGVVLTGADLDQVLGLLLLRELQPIEVFATATVRSLLKDDNSFFRMLERQAGQSRWTDIVPGQPFVLPSDGGAGIRVQPLALPGKFPAYVIASRAQSLYKGEMVVGLVLESDTGKRLAYLANASAVDEKTLALLRDCDLLLFDGTFWSDDELQQVQGGGNSARQMGHLPISGPAGSLEVLAAAHKPRKIFVHMNNTNPILDEQSAAHRQVREGGWEVGEDGWEFVL